MTTKIINTLGTTGYTADLLAAANSLRSGGLVVFPTETVYGVGANAADKAAMARLRALKGRSFDQPFTLHLGDRVDAALYVRQPPPIARRLARKLWPGPLTLVCEETAPSEAPIAQRVSANQLGEIFHEGTVGLRFPDHSACQRLLSEAGAPIVASSANRAGAPPPFTLADTLKELDGEVDFAIDGGRTRFNTASTIVEIRGDGLRIRRVGVIDERTIRRLALSTILFVCTGNSCRSPMAEYIFRQKLAARLGYDMTRLEAAGYVIASAGTSAPIGGPMSQGTFDELTRRGIEVRSFRSQPLTVEAVQRAERVFVMSPEHRRTVLELAPAAAGRVEMLDPAGPVSDPIGGGPEDYARCAAQIERAIETRVEEFLHEDRNW